MTKALATSAEVTQRIKELEALPDSPEIRQEIRDAYWCRRRLWEKERNIPTVCHNDGCPV